METEFWVLASLIVVFTTIPWLIFYFQKSSFLRKKIKYQSNEEEKINIIQSIDLAIESLVSDKKGATIILDDFDDVEKYVADFEYLDAYVSSSLIVNIFEGTYTPLHDGALIINNNRIKSAAAYISRLSSKKLPKKFGTRHRSALGLSEATNAIIIVLSEETQNIHFFYHGDYEKIERKEFFEKIYKIWIEQKEV
ncbi:/ / DNA integrity scanning protein DisA / 39050:39634 Forward [Candidatus Hepatoplasma crinochetorum]|uniref:/ / DNA integrity scanning protein DisA / 39050:39634 Forward n=1 Tax=Candidatus Hepatoplasma crinochetorum TaxID=295596 RepID=A0A0G7ZNB0_9MOLU|nr:/ / DNA integrity scanning protein DisA / 39050:39634 Forward [Candidatus Hepatoplasma crinochetorum]